MFKFLCAIPFVKRWVKSTWQPSSTALNKQLFGLTFRNPVGLGAGFDKNARYLDELALMGFGFVEIGTVTPQPQEGNEKPRLFRLPEDLALINRMGFNNEGVKVISNRLRLWRKMQASHAGQLPPLIIGGNIGKNKNTPNEEAWKDYETCFRALFDCVDYFVVNVSSPNTPGLRALQDKEALQKILSHLQLINSQQSQSRPILLKIAPDLTKEQLDDVVDLATQIKLDGLVVANTTIKRDQLITSEKKLHQIGPGGLSGKPLFNASSDMLEYIHGKSAGAFPLIASGGIFNGGDALVKIKAGAALVQVWTGFIYEGPGIVKRLCAALLK